MRSFSRTKLFLTKAISFMSFHPITVSTKTWNEVGPGRYMDSTVAYGNPANYIQISGGTKNSKTQVTSAAVSRVMQKDVTVGSVTTRNQASVQLVIQVGPGFTSAEVDSMLLTISDFVTSAVLDRVLLGER